MTPITTPSDYIGSYEISKNEFTTDKFNESIANVEESMLFKLLGVELKVLNLASPANPLYTKIRDPFVYQEDCGVFLESTGIKEMMKGFVYFEYCKDLTNQMTVNGNVRPTGENSGDVSTLYSMMYARYNEAVKTFRAIQTHIVNNFNAPIGQIISASITNSGSGYTGQPNVSVTGGNGTGAIVSIDEIGGSIDAVYFTSQGVNYQVGDVLTITGGNNDATVTVDIIGTGNYNNFAGVNKQFSYWI